MITTVNSVFHQEIFHVQVILNVSWLLLGNVKVHVELSLFSLTTSSTSDFFPCLLFSLMCLLCVQCLCKCACIYNNSTCYLP